MYFEILNGILVTSLEIPCSRRPSDRHAEPLGAENAPNPHHVTFISWANHWLGLIGLLSLPWLAWPASARLGVDCRSAATHNPHLANSKNKPATSGPGAALLAAIVVAVCKFRVPRSEPGRAEASQGQQIDRSQRWCVQPIV